MFAKFDEIPSMILQDIKETKCYGHTHGRTDNVKTVYPPTNAVCGGYNEDDQIKNEGARVFTRFLPLYVYGDFSRRSRAANSAVLGPIWPNFELLRDVMNVLVTCKYEEDPIKNEGARVDTTFYPL